MKLNLIWLLEKNGVFESDWIKELFSQFEIEEYVDSNLEYNYIFDNSLIIIQNITDSTSFENYLSNYEKNNFNFRILHISDEALNHNISFYEKFQSKIIRMIYSEEYSNKYNIITIPVGYKPGIKKVQTEKSYFVNFVGQLKSDRQYMLSVYSNVNPKFILLTNQWNDPNGLSTEEYSRILSESSFTLCPAGWVSVDSFRINEALECGSIPVSILYNGKNYFESVYGPNPFVLGRNWEETVLLIQSIDIIQKKKEIQDWWSNYKSELKMKMTSLFKK